MLLTLEGLDGSGKTTAWQALRDRYPSAVFTREPTDSWYGEAVARSIADDDADPLAELFLYTADHADHLSRVVRPALDEGSLVVSDRYSDSRIAYQAATLTDHLDDPFDYVRSIHEPFSRPPDATLYFDLDPETAAKRSGGTNKFERVDHLRAVRTQYERLLDAEPDRFVCIDATQSREAVLDDVFAAVDDLV
ncbi:dTMP kinase [Haloplanus aerogenes]|uniref:Probable thymidylate kinase n=1 Tax=Haloplanus aerogenes TaxID=660522 RepID=A0A3G8QVX7_9EURY|nr:dTMP kinase [Haloplanus aerogenes]AZH26630.1 dTMP kinase [Haloplanus aerogenes]RMB12863.1 dTMP kinase [Haloplanus aerogenes]